MFKAQLKSKLPSFIDIDEQGHARKTPWWQLEDLLTSEFWGVLDYLPRRPYLRDFIQHARNLNSNIRIDLELSDKEWDEVELLFWPRWTVSENPTEPDVVVISSRWIIVVEVKLHSGLRGDQIRRELLVGVAIARERNIPIQSVYILVQTLAAPDLSAGFYRADNGKTEEMRMLYIRWSDILEIMEAWRRNPEGLAAKRIIDDLVTSLRRRRSLAFSGFRIRGHGCVRLPTHFFSNVFRGFLHDFLEVRSIGFFFARDVAFGFLEHALLCSRWITWLTGPSSGFSGFLLGSKTVTRAGKSRLSGTGFDGFLLASSGVLKRKVWFIKGDER